MFKTTSKSSLSSKGSILMMTALNGMSAAAAASKRAIPARYQARVFALSSRLAIERR